MNNKKDSILKLKNLCEILSPSYVCEINKSLDELECSYDQKNKIINHLEGVKICIDYLIAKNANI